MANENPQGPQMPPQAPPQMPPQQPQYQAPQPPQPQPQYQAPQPQYQAPQQPYGPQPGFTPVQKPAATPSLTFPQALPRFFSNLFNFNGRDRKSAYWWPVLIIGGVWLISWFVMWASLSHDIDYAFYHGSFKVFYILQKVIAIAACVLLLGGTIRRLQDSNRSNIMAWLTAGASVADSFFCLLFVFAKVFFFWVLSWIFWVAWLVLLIILIVFLNQDSTPGSNQYGPSEKYPA